MFNNLSEIKDLKVYPFDIFDESWSENDVNRVVYALPKPSGIFGALDCPDDWRMKMFAEAMKTGRATVKFTDPISKEVHKLVFEYEGNGRFKFMNVPKCFHKYDGPMSFEIDERHLRLYHSNTLMDYRDIVIKRPPLGVISSVIKTGTFWGSTLKATTEAIKKLYEISEPNIIIALKELCTKGYVEHAGLFLSLSNYSKAVVRVGRVNSEYHRHREFVIDNNVLEEIMAAPMPEVKQKPKKPSKPTTPREPSLSELLSGLSCSTMFNSDTFK